VASPRFPKNLSEFQRPFNTEAACEDYRKGHHAVPILVAVEKRGDRSGRRVRMSAVPDFKGTTVTVLIEHHVAPGSTVYTGGFAALPKANCRYIART
jgi:hypothetical protein